MSQAVMVEQDDLSQMLWLSIRASLLQLTATPRVAVKLTKQYGPCFQSWEREKIVEEIDVAVGKTGRKVHPDVLAAWLDLREVVDAAA